MAPPQISFADLMETARSLPPEVRADPNRLMFTMAVTVKCLADRVGQAAAPVPALAILEAGRGFFSLLPLRSLATRLVDKAWAQSWLSWHSRRIAR